MKTSAIKTFFAGLLFVILASGVRAQQSGFGIGIILGEPTGVSFKSWIAPNGAIDAAVAWSLRTDYMHLHADYLRHSFKLIDVSQGKLPVYYGLGAKIVFANDPIFGARIPLGLDYLFEDAPLDIFAEIVPELELIPETRGNLAGGVGIRYYFK